MKDCHKNKELLYLKYWDVNSLYGKRKSIAKSGKRSLMVIT